MNSTFLQAHDPFPQNDIGHYLDRDLVGLGLTAKEQLARFKERGLLIDAVACELLELGADLYDQAHRLQPGQSCMLIFVSSRHLHVRLGEKTSKNFQSLIQSFQYSQPAEAEIQLLIHEQFDNVVCKEWMKRNAIYWVAALHRPLVNKEKRETILYSRLFGDELILTTDSGKPGREWHDAGLIAARI